jgi:uncharacterized protein (TIGR03435 family)
LFAAQCRPQTPPAAPQSFEVASIRQVVGEPGPTHISPSGTPQFTGENVSMTMLIGMAYGVKFNQIASRPAWFDANNYVVKAKPEGDTGLTYEQLRPLLQQLLKQRFHLALHHETRDVPGYALVVAKGGPKLELSKEAPPMGYITQTQLRSSTVQTLALMLAIPLARPVIDKTGLTGNYNILLNFEPVGATPSEDSDGPADSPPPSIFIAIEEQLGLKLESQKVHQDFLIIDHAEKIPTEN